MPNAPRLTLSLMAGLVVAFLLGACGSDKPKEAELDDPNPENLHFHVAADATRFGGPVPLAIRFLAQPFHAKGPVTYRWRFDDGTTSVERRPVKIFKEPGYYQVQMEARDARGHDAWNLIVGAWPPELWNYRQRKKGGITASSIRKLQKGQSLRTAKRRKAIVARSKKRAAQYSTKPAT